MPHTIVTDVCEGVADCVSACPVACIHEGPGKNVKGTDWYWIDFATCIDCGICIQVCPVSNAIVAEERPDLQKIKVQPWDQYLKLVGGQNNLCLRGETPLNTLAG